MCKLDIPFVGPPGFSFEKVDLTPLLPTAARLPGGGGGPLPVLLTGYGCTGNQTARQKIDGKYRIGLTALVDSSASPAAALGARYYAKGGGEANNLFTSPTGPNLCPGDSGGPAFMVAATPAGSGGQYAHRAVIGVNSRVFFGDKDRKTYGASAISALGAGGFERWAIRWLGPLPACGLTGTLPNCPQ